MLYIFPNMSSRTVPFVEGFKKCSTEDSAAAIGSFEETESENDLHKNHLFEPNSDSFEPVHNCRDDNDWLAVYNEAGQTFEEYKARLTMRSGRMKPNSNASKKTIYILPLGQCPPGSPSIETLAECTRAYFSSPVIVLPPVELQGKEDNIYWKYNGERILLKNTRYHSKGGYASRGHRQLHVDSILETLMKLRKSMEFQNEVNCSASGSHLVSFLTVFIRHNVFELPNALCQLPVTILPNQDAFCVMALTMEDVYQSKDDLFVAGVLF